MRKITMRIGRSSLGLVIVSAFLLSCSPDGAPLESVSDLALGVLRVAVINTVEDLGHDRFLPEQIVIDSDFQLAPTAKDVLRERGLEPAAVMQHLATDLGHRTGLRDDLVTCVDHAPGVRHPCRLLSEGAFYHPVITSLSEESATVAVYFLANANPGNREGTRVVDLVLTPEGWTEVDASYVTH